METEQILSRVDKAAKKHMVGVGMFACLCTQATQRAMMPGVVVHPNARVDAISVAAGCAREVFSKGTDCGR